MIVPVIRGFSISDGQLSDIKALMDTYGIELKAGKRVYHRCPLWYVAMLPPGGPSLMPAPLFAIDKDLKPSMIRTGGPWGDEEEASTGRGESERWPFFVEAQLVLWICGGSQWWKFVFHPDTQYEERAWTPADGTEAPAPTPAGGNA